MNRRGRGPAVSLLLAVAALLAAAACAAAASMPHHHQMTALYVIDHNGANPRDDAVLVAYSRPFEKILVGCRINVDDLTNMALQLADKASVNGGRVVTSLDMLRAIARRISWRGVRGCGYIYNLAEARQEAGNP